MRKKRISIASARINYASKRAFSNMFVLSIRIIVFLFISNCTMIRYKTTWNALRVLNPKHSAYAYSILRFLVSRDEIHRPQYCVYDFRGQFECVPERELAWSLSWFATRYRRSFCRRVQKYGSAILEPCSAKPNNKSQWLILYSVGLLCGLFLRLRGYKLKFNFVFDYLYDLSFD